VTDARITPVRDGIAARGLEGEVAATAYVDPAPMRCALPAAALRRAADDNSEQMDQLLFGEAFDALAQADGYLWGQARRDGYVGFVRADALAPAGATPTHRMGAIRSYAFVEPSIKSRAVGPFSLGALVTVTGHDGRLAHVEGAGWVAAEHLTPIGAFEGDPAAVAERYLGAPYLWGGRESLGLDCSGLVQQALFACGLACPRDADQQARLGAPIGRGEVRRNDLVFWKGHVALALDETRIIHANAFHMAVAVEPLDAAIRRIQAGGSEPTGFRRILESRGGAP
jgi:cell wall-associated NlpC family hydrolase